MKRLTRQLVPILFILSIFVGIFTIQLISQIRSYGNLINYVGIVRGATQRLVKLELNGKPNDDLIAYLDEIIYDLNTGEGDYDLVVLDNKEYTQDLAQLNLMWSEVKEKIHHVRLGQSSTALLNKSEIYFTLANDTVFTAQEYSSKQTKKLTILIMLIISATTITWALSLTFYLKRLKRLESDNQGLSDIAFIDKLTGAPNLEKFKIDAQDMIMQYRNQKFAVLYIDFENFKYLNDVFGYSYGDKVLKEYSDLLKNDIGQFDAYCRISADNFLVLRSYEDKESLLVQQQQIDAQMSNFALESKEKNFIWVCCGICCREDVFEELSISDLIERANFARKRSKSQPHLHYTFYDESIRQKILAEKSIENHMQEALVNGEFMAYLQPKVDLITGKIACAEALARWKTADGTMISPGEFIPIFEKNLFITTLDQYILKEVCKWMRFRLDAGLPMVPVSVNVSRMQLYDLAFLPTYTKIKKEYGIPNFMLEVEFTESVVFENMDLLLKIIKELKEVGFHCSLDDFGKGYSSLNLLKNLNVDVLKLDSLFFEDDENSAKAHIVVEGIISIAKNLKLQTVAEGVEHQSQLDFLREIGCDLVQGYVYYKPMPISEFNTLLQTQ